MIIRPRIVPPESSRRPRHGREPDEELGEELGREARNGQEPGRAEQRACFEEIDVLWISEGMSCDGDTISITAAEKPSIEDVLLGLIPGLPKVNLHNKLLSPTQGGEDFLAPFRAAAAGRLEPFILVIEGSIPNQNIIEGDGYWTSFGNDPDTGQPLTVNWWIDQLAPKAWAVMAVGTCATYGGIHAMAGNPTGAMGLGDYLGWDFESAGGLPIVNVPGCPVQPENFMDTLTWMLYHAAGTAPPPPLDGMLRPEWIFDRTVHDGCDRAADYEQGNFAADFNAAEVPRQARLLGAGRQLQRAQAWLDRRRRRVPQRRRDLHRLHHARLPRRVHAVHGRAGRGRARLRGDQGVRRLRPPDASHHRHGAEPGAGVAAQRSPT